MEFSHNRIQDRPVTREARVMLRTIEEMAEVSVARGCGFGALGIGTIVVGLSAQLALAFKAGGILMLIMCLVLVLKAWRAERSPYKRTELWVMLKPAERPQAVVAQQVIGGVLRETYLRYALRTAVIAAVLLAASFAMTLLPGATG